MSNSRITPTITAFIALAVVAVILYILNVKPKAVIAPDVTPESAVTTTDVVAPVDNAVETVVAPIDATKITQ